MVSTAQQYTCLEMCEKKIPRPQLTYIANCFGWVPTTAIRYSDICKWKWVCLWSITTIIFTNNCKKILQAGANHIALTHFTATLVTIFWKIIEVADSHWLSSDRGTASLTAFHQLHIGEAMWKRLLQFSLHKLEVIFCTCLCRFLPGFYMKLYSNNLKGLHYREKKLVAN